MSLKTLDEEPDCGIKEGDTDFQGALKEIVSHDNVPSTELCRLRCRDEDMCGHGLGTKRPTRAF
jgi:hypothetical protein